MDKGHGRIEQRTLRTTVALNAYLDFPHVGQVCRIERQVTVSKTGRTRTEQIFCITDLTPEQADPGQLLALNRGHWSIENRLHWVRDVTVFVKIVVTFFTQPMPYCRVPRVNRRHAQD